MDEEKVKKGRMILRSCRIGTIVCKIAKALGIADMEALRLFYRSETCREFHDRSSGLYLQGDLYIVDDFMREYNSLPR